MVSLNVYILSLLNFINNVSDNFTGFDAVAVNVIGKLKERAIDDSSLVFVG